MDFVQGLFQVLPLIDYIPDTILFLTAALICGDHRDRGCGGCRAGHGVGRTESRRSHAMPSWPNGCGLAWYFADRRGRAETLD